MRICFFTLKLFDVKDYQQTVYYDEQRDYVHADPPWQLVTDNEILTDNEAQNISEIGACSPKS
jgi:hypothetical protein